MNDRVRRFVNDKETAKAVFDAILTSFLKSKPNEDVYHKAARAIAIERLQDAWSLMGHTVAVQGQGEERNVGM